MIDHKHDCLCCSSLVGELFRAAQTHTGIDNAVDVGEVALMPLGKIIDRRTVLKTCAALAGAAATASVLSPSAVAQPAGVTVFRNGTILTVDKAFSEATDHIPHSRRDFLGEIKPIEQTFKLT